MDKLYSKTALIAKTIFSVLLSPLFFILSFAMINDDTFLHIIFSALPIGCLFTIPFWMSLSKIKEYCLNGVRRYIMYDFVSCVIPAILGILFTEIIYTIIVQNVEGSGIFTLIFSAIFLIIAMIFWMMYIIFSRIK